MITSRQNPQLKAVMQLLSKPKARREQKLFVAEGIKMFSEVPPERVEKVYIAERLFNTGKYMDKLNCFSYEVVEDKVFESISDTGTPQGILVLVRQKESDLRGILSKEANPSLLILETIQDPGNLGTMLRTAEGAGITGVIMNSKTVDIYNPKVIRSTMGSIYRVPFYYTEDLKGVLTEIRGKGIKVTAAHLRGETDYNQEDYRTPCAFLIGNEGKGLDEETAALADCYVKIPMEGKVESLNAAIAAALLMYEAYTQRRDT